MLPDAGTDVGVQGGYFGYPFHDAAYGGHLRVLKLLISNEITILLYNGCRRTLL